MYNYASFTLTYSSQVMCVFLQKWYRDVLQNPDSRSTSGHAGRLAYLCVAGGVLDLGVVKRHQSCLRRIPEPTRSRPMFPPRATSYTNALIRRRDCEGWRSVGQPRLRFCPTSRATSNGESRAACGSLGTQRGRVARCMCLGAVSRVDLGKQSDPIAQRLCLAFLPQ